MYSENDFSGCLFNPLVKKPMLKVHPRLSEICPPDNDQLPFFDQILRYMCLLYDPKSPLIINERDLNYRKSVAAELAGFDSETDEEFLQTIYDSKLEWVTTLIMRFLTRFIKQRQWAFIVSIEMAYWENIQRIMKPVEKGKEVKDWDELKSIEIKSKLKDEAEKDLKRLDTLYKSFYNEDDGLEDAAKNIRLTPERIAKSVNTN